MMKKLNGGSKIKALIPMTKGYGDKRAVLEINGNYYVVSAVVYGEPSIYGIDGSQISKLWIQKLHKDEGEDWSGRTGSWLIKGMKDRQIDAEDTVNYERGWSEEPKRGSDEYLIVAAMLGMFKKRVSPDELEDDKKFLLK